MTTADWSQAIPVTSLESLVPWSNDLVVLLRAEQDDPGLLLLARKFADADVDILQSSVWSELAKVARVAGDAALEVKLQAKTEGRTKKK